MKKQAMNENIKNEIAKGGIIAVLEIENEKNAVPLAKALIEGGINVIELALRTPAAVPSISLIAKEVPQMFLGAGTIIETEQVSMLRTGRNQTDVRFGVSPGINPLIVKEAIALELPFAPGISTPSELELAISLGCTTVKFFPAEALGGLSYLKNINAPYNHLGIKYIPLGGISIDNLASYAKFAPVLAVGGSWIASKELINTQYWAEITKRAKEALNIWKSNR